MDYQEKFANRANRKETRKDWHNILPQRVHITNGFSFGFQFGLGLAAASIPLGIGMGIMMLILTNL